MTTTYSFKAYGVSGMWGHFFLALALVAGLVAVPTESRASWCEGREAAPFDEALEKAALVFSGKVVKMTWKGLPRSRETKDADGSREIVTDYIDPNAPDLPFDPQNQKVITRYTAYFEVSKVWKDETNRVANGQISVVAMNGGWQGFKFASGEEYLVFARDGGDSTRLPFASLCSRTRPLIYATDDLKLLNKLKGRDNDNRQ